MIYIKKTFSSGEISLYRGGPGGWYGHWWGHWEPLTKGDSPDIMKALEEAVEKGHSVEVRSECCAWPEYPPPIYHVIIEEEAVMILFQETPGGRV